VKKGELMWRENLLHRAAGGRGGKGEGYNTEIKNIHQSAQLRQSF